MAETLAELVARISADATELKKGLSDAEKAIQGTGKVADKETKSIKDKFLEIGKVATVMGAAITTTMVMMIKSFADTGSELHDLSLKTGVSVEALAGLKYAAEQNGASLGTVEMALKRTAMVMSDVADGSLESTRAFGKLGLSLTDLQGLNPEEQFLKIAGAIAEVPDPMQRAALAVDLFGRSGTDMLPMLSQGAEGLRKMMEEGQKLTGWTGKGATSADAFGDAMGTLKTSMQGIFNVIGAALAPALKDMIGIFANIIGKVKEWMDTNPQLVKALGAAALAIGVVATAVGLASIAVKYLGTVVNLQFGGILLIIGALVTAGVLLWQNWDKVSHFFQDVWSNMKNAVLHAVDFMLAGLEKFLGWIPGLGAKLRSAREAIANLIDANKIARDAADAERSTKELTDTIKSELEKITPATLAAAKAKEELEGKIASVARILGIEETALGLANKQLEDAQKDYDKTKKSSAGFADVITDLNSKIKTHQGELRDAQDKLKGFQTAYEAASEKVKGFERAVDSANRELQELTSPRLEGMQAVEDQLFDIEIQIKKLKLAALQPSAHQENIANQIEGLELRRTKLELERDIKFDPLIRSASEAVETITGMNKEILPQSVMERISELGESLSASGVLGKGLAEARREFDNATRDLEEQRVVIQNLEKDIQSWQTALEVVDEKIQEILDKKQATIDEFQGISAAIEDMVKKAKGSLPELQSQLDGTWDKFIEDAQSAKSIFDSFNIPSAPLGSTPREGSISAVLPESAGAGKFIPNPGAYMDFVGAYAGYATGGIVPGPIGMPQLAMVHGGETITPPGEAVGITINFTQPVFFDREDTMNKFVDMIRKGVQRQDRLRFGGAYSG